MPDGATLAALGMEVCEERPSLARPAGVGERVVAVPLLVGQLRIAELDRPLLDVEAELRIVERQHLQAAEEPHERDPVIGWEIAPEHGMLVVIGEDAERVTNLLEAHALALKLRAYVLEDPRARLRPVDFAALRIKLPPVLGDEFDADEIDGERLCDELGVDPVFHGAGAPRARAAM